MARIDLNNIRHAYMAAPKGDDDFALKRVHHTFDDGGAYALLGPSGCGKTTLLNIMSGLLRRPRAKSCSTGAMSRACRRKSATSPRCSSFRWSTIR